MKSNVNAFFATCVVTICFSIVIVGCPAEMPSGSAAEGADKDGDGAKECAQGQSSTAQVPCDCDDNDANIGPDAREYCGNGKDDNCANGIDDPGVCPSAASPTCNPGYHLVSGACILDAVTCGAGYHVGSNGQCVQDGNQGCDPGYTLVNGACVQDGGCNISSCPAGQHVSNCQCVPDNSGGGGSATIGLSVNVNCPSGASNCQNASTNGTVRFIRGYADGVCDLVGSNGKDAFCDVDLLNNETETDGPNVSSASLSRTISTCSNPEGVRASVTYELTGGYRYSCEDFLNELRVGNVTVSLNGTQLTGDMISVVWPENGSEVSGCGIIACRTQACRDHVAQIKARSANNRFVDCR